mgnify:CR=1 FL=1
MVFMEISKCWLQQFLIFNAKAEEGGKSLALVEQDAITFKPQCRKKFGCSEQWKANTDA